MHGVSRSKKVVERNGQYRIWWTREKSTCSNEGKKVCVNNETQNFSDPQLGRQCEGGQESNVERWGDDQNYQKKTAYKIVPNASRPSRHARKLPTASVKLRLRGIRAMTKAVRETSQRNNASLLVPGKRAPGSSLGKVPRTLIIHHQGTPGEFWKLVTTLVEIPINLPDGLRQDKNCWGLTKPEGLVDNPAQGIQIGNCVRRDPKGSFLWWCH